MSKPVQKGNPLEEPIVLVPKDAAAESEVSATLQQQGHKVIVCREPKKVFDIGAGKPSFWKPKMIVVDVILPTMSSFELVRQLVEKYASKKVPIVMASTYESKEDEMEASNVGAASLVKKPITAQMIQEILEKEEQKRLKGEQLIENFEHT